MNNQLTVGDVVQYGKGHMRVRAVFKNTVNLGHVWGSKTIVKQVPHNQVKEDYQNWYNNWTQSEQYQCM